MVNRNSTVSNIREYIKESGKFDKVLSYHNTNEGKIIFEARGSIDLTETEIRSDTDFAMLFTTYGMTVLKKEDSEGDIYYEFECNDNYLINDT